jgi:small subunit ribosomal protein S20
VSAEKTARVSKRKRDSNRIARGSSKTAVKKALSVLGRGGDEPTDKLEIVAEAVKALDKAAQKGVIHPNNAARRKSRLMKRLNREQA